MVLLFKGAFDNEYANNLIHTLMENILKDEKKGDKRKIIFHVAIELLQNVSRHGLKINGVTQGIFILKFKNNSFEIITKNYAHQKDVDKLNNEFSFLNEKKLNELAQIYKERLRKNVRNNLRAGELD